jgi:serralysin
MSFELTLSPDKKTPGGKLMTIIFTPPVGTSVSDYRMDVLLPWGPVGTSFTDAGGIGIAQVAIPPAYSEISGAVPLIMMHLTDPMLTQFNFINVTLSSLGGTFDLISSTNPDYFFGDASGNARDLVKLGDGDDHAYGESGHDVVFGGLGDDFIDGGAGNDRLSGDSGNDTMYGGAGNDNMSGGIGNDAMFGGDGNDTMDGGSGRDSMRGGNGADLMKGGAGNDLIRGEAGDDKLSGGDGNDHLAGGEGRDSLSGGAGADQFIFRTIADSDAGNPDFIVDFNAAEGDVVVLTEIDADVTTDGDQAFTYMEDAFTGHAGELIAVVIRDGQTLVQGDVDGDGVADFGFLMEGDHTAEVGAWLL